jgi:hypothetical protein
MFPISFPKKIQNYVPKKSLQEDIANALRTIFGSPDREKADIYLKYVIVKYARFFQIGDLLESDTLAGLMDLFP